MRITLKERRYTRPALTAGGSGHCAAVCRVSATAAEARRARVRRRWRRWCRRILRWGRRIPGRNLPRRRSWRLIRELSLYPGMSYCAGIPELASTRCIRVIPLGEEQRMLCALPARTDLIVGRRRRTIFMRAIRGFARRCRSWRARRMRRLLWAISGSMRTRRCSAGYDLYNSADFVAPDGSFVGRYDKMHLVPFGEYMPYKKLFFFAGSLLAGCG